MKGLWGILARRLLKSNLYCGGFLVTLPVTGILDLIQKIGELLRPLRPSTTHQLRDDAKAPHACDGRMCLRPGRGAGGRHRVRPEPAVLPDRRQRLIGVDSSSELLAMAKANAAALRFPSSLSITTRNAFRSPTNRRHRRDHLVVVLDPQSGRRAQGDAARAEAGRRADFCRTRPLSRRRHQEMAESADADLAPIRGRLPFEPENGRSGARRGLHDRRPAHGYVPGPRPFTFMYEGRARK